MRYYDPILIFLQNNMSTEKKELFYTAQNVEHRSLEERKKKLKALEE